MLIDRRAFLVLGAAFAAGCVSAPGGATFSSGKDRLINAGPAAQYVTDGIYTRFRDRGFFIVRRGPVLLVLSAICTHRNCKLDAEPDKSFYCPCHDSTFDPDGKVTQGPARKNLPVYATSTDEKGNLLISIPGGS